MEHDPNNKTRDSKDDDVSAMRRCVVCRRKQPRLDALRFVLTPEGAVIFDARRRAPGRGVNVCARPDCLEKAARGAFRRGFKRQDVTSPPPQALLNEHVLPALRRRLDEVISLGRRSGQLISGSNQVERALARGALVAVVLATDASDNTRDRFIGRAIRDGLRVLGLYDRAALGALIGREQGVVLGWQPGALHDEALRLELQLRQLGAAADEVAGPDDTEHHHRRRRAPPRSRAAAPVEDD